MILFDTYAWIEFFKGTSDGNKIDIDIKTTTIAGKINFERKKSIADWGMIDSLVLSSALVNDLKILTGDNHFEDLPNVIML